MGSGKTSGQTAATEADRANLQHSTQSGAVQQHDYCKLGPPLAWMRVVRPQELSCRYSAGPAYSEIIPEKSGTILKIGLALCDTIHDIWFKGSGVSPNWLGMPTGQDVCFFFLQHRVCEVGIIMQGACGHSIQGIIRIQGAHPFIYGVLLQEPKKYINL